MMDIVIILLTGLVFFGRIYFFGRIKFVKAVLYTSIFVGFGFFFENEATKGNLLQKKYLYLGVAIFVLIIIYESKDEIMKVYKKAKRYIRR